MFKKEKASVFCRFWESSPFFLSDAACGRAKQAMLKGAANDQGIMGLRMPATSEVMRKLGFGSFIDVFIWLFLKRKKENNYFPG